MVFAPRTTTVQTLRGKIQRCTTIAKKPGHLIKDCHTFKARVDAGIIVTYASRQLENQTTPSRREQGKPRRGHAVNHPRVQAATRRPAPTLVEPTRPTTTTVKPSSSRTMGKDKQPSKGKVTHKRINKKYPETDSESDDNLSGYFNKTK
jgi:hypothetical protein